jgi:hypothetical protein
MSAGHTPEGPDRRDDPEGPEGPATPVVLVELWEWVRGRLIVTGRGLLLFGLALTGLSLLAALAGLLVVILRLIARGQLHHHIQFLVPAGLLAIAGWLVVGLLFLLCMRQLEARDAIAQRLVITERAVAKHTASIFLKLDLQPSDDDNRRVLAVLAYLEG